MKQNQIIITSSSPEIGRVEEIIECENKNNKEIKISFSSRYMLEALKVFNDKEIRLLLNGEIKPIILKEIEKEELIELILPIKTY